MANKIKGVCIKVHPEFFNMFETKRRNYENKFKVTLSQIKTSELMTKEFFNVKQPKVKIRKSHKYYPKFNQRSFLI